MPYLGFKAIAQGDSHRENELPCQDAVFSIISPRGGLVIVADGHGSEKHFRSDAGSQIAVDVAYKAIAEFIKIRGQEIKSRRDSDEVKKTDEQLTQLERTIIIRWRSAALEHFAENQLTENEREICAKENIDMNDDDNQVRAYGTTLIAAYTRKDLWFALQIGDGKCVVIDNEGEPYFPPALEDERLAGGMTTSLCDSDASGNFRHDFGFDRILGVTVATDGVTDSFVPEEYLKLHTRLLADFREDQKKAREGLQNSIAVWSTKGSRDDVAMAGVFYKKGLFD
jgi:serine/threonine protein phosphatase PrpC